MPIERARAEESPSCGAHRTINGSTAAGVHSQTFTGKVRPRLALIRRSRLHGVSTTVAPMRSAIEACAAGGIIR
jgi:hypothetical protein